jgi:hypothetical protein
MRIEDFGGTSIVDDATELEVVLERRYGSGVNEFWLFPNEEKSPTMSIVVNKGLASLTYFPGGDHPGFTSRGEVEGIDPEGFSTFFINTPTEKHEVSNDSLVPMSAAVQAAKQFFASLELPSGIEWFEL